MQTALTWKYPYKVGEIVWAKVTGYPWWPGVIVALPATKMQFFKVEFICEDSYAYVTTDKLAKYSDLSPIQLKKVKSWRLKQAISQAHLQLTEQADTHYSPADISSDRIDAEYLYLSAVLHPYTTLYVDYNEQENNYLYLVVESGYLEEQKVEIVLQKGWRQYLGYKEYAEYLLRRYKLDDLSRLVVDRLPFSNILVGRKGSNRMGGLSGACEGQRINEEYYHRRGVATRRREMYHNKVQPNQTRRTYRVMLRHRPKQKYKGTEHLHCKKLIKIKTIRRINSLLRQKEQLSQTKRHVISQSLSEQIMFIILYYRGEKMHKLLKWLQTSNVDNIVNSYENWSVRGGNTIIEYTQFY